jgi:hypothetical protein
MIVFSFSLYGANPKYTHGTLANAHIIKERFPDAKMYVYAAESVPADIKEQLKAMPHVRLIPVPSRKGSQGMFDRFIAIDDPDCDIMFIRDADSRIHERDIACIEDFIADPSKLIQIIRDHKWHSYRILGGTFAIRKEAMITSMTSLIAKASHYGTNYGCDQNFLVAEFYKKYLDRAQIYDRYAQYEPPTTLTPFRVPIKDNLFVGQVHLYREDGTEYTEFDAY